MKLKRLLAAVLAISTLIVMCTGLSGCGKSGEKTFTYITSMTDEPRTSVINKAVDKLKEKYPDWEFVNDSGGDYAEKMKLAFSSGEGYDLVYVDDLNQQTLQGEGYLMDITQYVEQNGWLDRQVGGAIEFNNARTPGQYYSVSTLMAPLSVFYNKTIFDELGLKEPTTIAEFEACCDALLAAGYIPMESAKNNIPGWIWESLVLDFTPKADVDKWYYMEESTDAFAQGATKAAEYLQKWNGAGYFRDGYTGTSYDEVATLFAMGESAMVLDGDWMISAYETNTFDVGVFTFPVAAEGDTAYCVNATDGAWALNAKLSEERTQIALDFIDIITSPEIAKEWVAIGCTTTYNGDTSDVAVSALRTEFNDAVAGSSMGYYLDNCKSGFLDVMNREITELVTDVKTPSEYWSALNEEWNAK